MRLAPSFLSVLIVAATAGDRAGAEPARPDAVVENSLGMTFVRVPPGTFTMGSPMEEPGRERQETPHEVVISRGFLLGRHEVTVGQFTRFVRDTGRRTDAERDGKGAYGIDAAGKIGDMEPQFTWRSPGFVQADDHPVVDVSWDDAQAFCAWLGSREGRRYRLPTEAEWEYACRAGTTTPWHSGEQRDSLQDCANIADRQFFLATKAPPDGELDDGFATLAPVGSKAGNDFGCHDMHGNVAEPCLEPDESVPGRRVVRGGSWLQNHEFARSAYRSSTGADDRSEHIGVRPARSLH
jgi:formylglycine-generating enzyme required for sulfatase activity